MKNRFEMMSRLLLLTAILTSLGAPSVAANDDPDYAPIEISKRTEAIKFVNRDDHRLLEDGGAFQRNFKFETTIPTVRNTRSDKRESMWAVLSISEFKYLIGGRMSQAAGWQFVPYAEKHLILGKKSPLKMDVAFLNKIKNKEIAFLVVEETIKTLSPTKEFQAPNHLLKIYTETGEEAKLVTQFVIGVLENDILLPVNERLVKQINLIHADIRAVQSKVKSAPGELQEVRKLVDESDPFDATELQQLRHQMRMLQIERAGLQARIQACKDVLAKQKEKNTSQHELVKQTENLMLDAEIELVGTVASARQIQIFIDQGNQAEKAKQKFAQLSRSISNANQSILTKRNRLFEPEKNLPFSMPLAIPNNTVEIRPIKWK